MVHEERKEGQAMKSPMFSLLMICVLFVGVAEAADDWVQKYPTSKPAERVFHAMAYTGDDLTRIAD